MAMSEFSPLCLSLVISLLVSGILLGLPFLFSSKSSTLMRRVRHFFISFIILSPVMLSAYLFFYLIGLNPDLIILKQKGSVIRLVVEGDSKVSIFQGAKGKGDR